MPAPKFNKAIKAHFGIQARGRVPKADLMRLFGTTNYEAALTVAKGHVVVQKEAQRVSAYDKKKEYNKNRNQRLRNERSKYIDVALRITIQDVRSLTTPDAFPAAYQFRVYDSIETFIGVSQTSINERLAAIKSERGWIAFEVMSITVRDLPKQFVANMELDYGYYIVHEEKKDGFRWTIGTQVVDIEDGTTIVKGYFNKRLWEGIFTKTERQSVPPKNERPAHEWLTEHKDSFIENVEARHISDDSQEPHLLGLRVNIEGTANRTRARQPLKLAFAYHIDGAETQPWNKDNGTCVIDFLVWRYGNMRGLKKKVTFDNLLRAFADKADCCPTFDEGEIEVEEEQLVDINKGCWNLHDDDPFDYVPNMVLKKTIKYVEPVYDPLVHGVCMAQIEAAFCRPFNIPMYALDDSNNVFHKYLPEKPDHNFPSLCFKVFDNHMYPITDRGAVNGITKTIKMAQVKSEDMQRIDAPKKKAEIEVIDCTQKDTVQLFLEKCAAEQMYPAQRFNHYGFTYNGKEVMDYKLKGVKYVFAADIETAQMLCEKLGVKYEGQSIGSLLIDIMNEKGDLPKSQMNPSLHEMFVSREQKRRVHRGFYGGKAPKSMDADGLQCFDINKCYTACLHTPMMDWGVLDFNDDAVECKMDEEFTGSIADGFYITSTTDKKLFVGNGIYSAPLIRKAIAEGIPFKVSHKIIPRQWVSKKTTTDIVNRVYELCDENESVMKTLNNKIAGMFGKTSVRQFKTLVTRSKDDVLCKFSTLTHTKGQIPFIHKRNVNGQDFWLYGFETTVAMTETNMPWYVQITDQANIMLYDLVQASGGFKNLVYRNTDCAVVRGGVTPSLDTKWGAVRESIVPHMTGGRYWDAVPRLSLWKNTLACNDSEKRDRITDAILRSGGGLVYGRAGTGKTYVAKYIASRLGERCARIAFTNKAALVVGGKTIHRMLALDQRGKMSVAQAHKIKKLYDWIIVDEISMVSKMLWSRLVFLKQLTDIKFVLLGDLRQCSPVEDEKIEHYFDHSAVKYLVRGVRCELTKAHRYDMELWNELENVWEERAIDLSKYRVEGMPNTRNICFFNETRVRVNKALMEARKPDDALFMPCVAGDDDSQDTYVFKGLPILARLNMDDGDTMANNEMFVVDDIEEDAKGAPRDVITCKSTIRDNVFECETAKFMRTFVPAYCTTTHKAQGDTIDENFTIWDWKAMDKRLRYTAMSRAKSAAQVTIVEGEGMKWGPLEKTIEAKIKGHCAVDSEKGQTCNLSVSFVRCLLVRQGFQCAKQCACDGSLKLAWTMPHDPKQFTIDRISVEKGHVKGNVIISCLSCNSGTPHVTL